MNLTRAKKREGVAKMIGDPARILASVRNSQNLRRAFRYALRDRLQDHYYDHFELDHASEHEEETVSELEEDLRVPKYYVPKPAFAFYPPKTDLCYRRMIYIPFKDLVARYALVIAVSDLLDPDLSKRCFANRRAHGEAARTQFLDDFATVSWPRFCKWQKRCATRGKYSTLLRTDISAFYDSVSHDYLVAEIANQLAINPESEVMVFFRILLRIPVISYCHLTRVPRGAETMHQGLAIGNNTEGVLANLYLRSIDDAMGKIKGVSFGRYNDDMRIFAAGQDSAKRAVLLLQEKLLTKGLNLNSAKTDRKEGPSGIAVEGL
jgi:hypothetical protein